jgi:uncharacterized membrane protein YciS (DUF1049 family)
MKRLILVLVLALLLVGFAASNVNQVKGKWGAPAKVEDRGDTNVYYNYFYRGKVSGLTSEITPAGVTAGWVIVEIITDLNGKVLKMRKYLKQPKPEDVKQGTHLK